MLPYILTDKSLTVVLDGKPHTMSSESANFPAAKKALVEERYDELPDLFDMAKAIDRGMRIEGVHLTEKHGGRSGSWTAD